MPLRFEKLENRVALSHGMTDHIHARLTITIEDDPIMIPANIGLGSGHYNPHTHAVSREPNAGHSVDDASDSGGIIHIGEGGPAGLSDDTRYVTLEDFFDVWREAEGTVITNVDATFASDEIMGHIVDRHHELTMLVNGEENAKFEKYVPHDQDDILIEYRRTSWAWQNYENALDTTGDGVVAPQDVLSIVIHINRNGAGPTDPSVEPTGYYDVSGDDVVAPNDVLQVIQHLNRTSNTK